MVLYSDCNLKTHVSEIEYRVFGFENHLIAPLKCTDTRDMGSTFHVPSLSFANKVLIVLHNKIMSWLINSFSHSFCGLLQSVSIVSKKKREGEMQRGKVYIAVVDISVKLYCYIAIGWLNCKYNDEKVSRYRSINMLTQISA